MKTAIYVRVSTETQSCEAQLHAISLFLETKGIKEYQIYSDEGISGAKSNRPQLKMLLNDCKQGKVELLVVWKLDRLFRSLSHLLEVIKQFEAYNVKFVSLQENIDLTTPSGKLIMHIMGALAQFERDMGIERTKMGLANARSKGVKLGAPRAIPQKLRDEAIELRAKGWTYRKVSEFTGLKVSTIQYLTKSSTVELNTKKIP